MQSSWVDQKQCYRSLWSEIQVVRVTECSFSDNKVWRRRRRTRGMIFERGQSHSSLEESSNDRSMWQNGRCPLPSWILIPVRTQWSMEKVKISGTKQDAPIPFPAGRDLHCVCVCVFVCLFVCLFFYFALLFLSGLKKFYFPELKIFLHNSNLQFAQPKHPTNELKYLKNNNSYVQWVWAMGNQQSCFRASLNYRFWDQSLIRNY